MNWTTGSQLPTQPGASDREDDFGDGVEDAKNGEFNDPSEGDDASLGDDYRAGHAAQTRMNQLDDVQRVAEHGLGQEEGGVGPDEMPVNGGGQPIAGAAEGEAGNVARTVAPRAAGAGLGDEVGENAGKAAVTTATTDAELGGPEDIFGDVVALAAGLGTLFGGLGGEKKAPTPVLRTPVNPSSERGL